MDLKHLRLAHGYAHVFQHRYEGLTECRELFWRVPDLADAEIIGRAKGDVVVKSVRRQLPDSLMRRKTSSYCSGGSFTRREADNDAHARSSILGVWLTLSRIAARNRGDSRDAAALDALKAVPVDGASLACPIRARPCCGRCVEAFYDVTQIPWFARLGTGRCMGLKACREQSPWRVPVTGDVVGLVRGVRTDLLDD